MPALLKAPLGISRMCGKERIEAALKFEAVDRVPWAPKVFIGHYRSGTSEAHRKMSISTFSEVLNCDAIGWDCPIKTHVRGVSTKTHKNNNETITITSTPVGELRRVTKWSETSRTGHVTEFPLKGPDDYAVARYIADHTTFEVDPEVHRETLASTGDRGVVMSHGMGTPLMHLLQAEMGMPQAYYQLEDHAEAFAELHEAMAARYIRFYEAYAKSDVEHVVTHENTSSSLLSPNLYETYCLPLKKRFRKLMRDAGKTCILHMCGTLKALLPRIKEINADCWESFTPPPTGNTFLADGRAVAGDEVCLIGGMDAVMLTQWKEQRILGYVDETLASLAHSRGIIFTSGGAMPVECPLDRLASLGSKLASHLTV